MSDAGQSSVGDWICEEPLEAALHVQIRLSAETDSAQVQSVGDPPQLVYSLGCLRTQAFVLEIECCNVLRGFGKAVPAA